MNIVTEIEDAFSKYNIIAFQPPYIYIVKKNKQTTYAKTPC